LSELASQIAPGTSPVSALDWFNGRRTPDADLTLKGALSGLTLGTTPGMIFRALVEATAYGSKAIVERFVSEGIRIESIIATGGIAQKSPFVMQTLADVLNMPVKVVDSDQACALGAAMCAATAAGLHPSLREAQRAMAAPIGREYKPNPDDVEHYVDIYKRYILMGHGGLR
jgi:L-ribulokinase